MLEPQTEQPGCVLLVEDDPAILWTYSRMLSEAGFAVEAVADGGAVPSALAAHHFDAVLSDIALPGMSGIEVLGLVHGCDPELPVILMTGGDVEEALAATERRALRYLLKPVRFDVLKACVAEAVRVRRSASLGKTLVGDGGVRS